MSRLEVAWIPAPPISGSVSMGRYWRALQENLRPDDPFLVKSVLEYADVPPGHGLLSRVMRQWERQVAYPLRLRARFSGDIAHILDHSWADLLIHVPQKAKKVATVHDLIPLRFSGELNAAQVKKYKAWVSNIKKCDLIISDSDYTREDIREFLGIESKRIRTVPLGVQLPYRESREFAGNRRSRLAGLPERSGKLILGSLGGTGRRKNLEILPDALLQALAEIQEGIILVRSGTKLCPELAGRLRKVLGSNGLVELGHIGDDDLGEFFKGVDAVVVPSLYEGFGLPVLEAMAWGTPVLSSSASSLPEVGGDTALYFDPNDANDLARCVVDFRRMPMKEELATRCRARAAGFTWRHSLEQLYQAYSTL